MVSTGCLTSRSYIGDPLTHQLSFCEMEPHPVVFPCHMLGRAGTCHLFFFPFQFLPLGLGLSTLGLFHYYILQRRGPQDRPHSYPYCYNWNECSPVPQPGSPRTC